MAEPLHTLEITDLAEVSFVDAGDNPDAGVVLMKARPNPSPPEKSMPDGSNDNEITKLREEHDALQKRVAAFEKAEQIGIIKARIAPADPALAADLYEIHKVSPDAAKRIEAELIRLAKGNAAADALTRRNGDAGALPTSHADRLEKAIAPLMAGGMSRAAAITKAIKADPTLYHDSTMGSL